MTQAVQILTPVGRLVAGHPLIANHTDAEGRPLVYKNGPNAGQPRSEYYIGLAIPKGAEQAWNQTEWGAQIYAAGQQDFPQGQFNQPNFAWKIVDGDDATPNTRGIAPNQREGYPGHWVLNCSGGYAPKVYATGGKEEWTQVDQVKRGWYVRAYLMVRGNGALQQPGVFLNPSMVEFIAYGEEIQTGPDAAAVFGGAPAPGNLPSGASMTPPAPSSAPAAPPIPGTPPAGTAPAAPVAAPAAPAAAPAPAAPSAAPVPGVTPAPDILTPDSLNPKQARMLPAAQHTYDQYIAAGWTEEQLVANGMMAP
jgi:hypothetical protein